VPRRDEDIFKKLKKEKPLVKTSADSEPVDPDRKSTFDLMLDKKTGSRKPDISRAPKRSSRTMVAKKASAEKKNELDVFSPSSKESVKAKEAVHDIDYGLDEKRVKAKSQEAVAKRQDKKRMPERKTSASMPKEELKPPISDSSRAQQKHIRADRKAEKLRQQALLQELELDKVSEEAQRVLSGKPEEELKPFGAETEEPRRAHIRADKPRPKEEAQPRIDIADEKRSEYSQVRKEPERKKMQTPELEFNEPERAKSTQPAAVKRQGNSAPMMRTHGAEVHAEEVQKTFRHELKYYINYKDHMLLRTALGALMRPDDNVDENGGYHIRSLYFDDIYETALSEKISGVDDRCKFRIRIYNLDDGNIKLEKKSKHGKFISKTSIRISRQEYDSIIAGDGSFLLEKDNAVAREFYSNMKMRLLRPRVLVDYWREAYVYPVEDTRITFDIDLKGSTMLTDIFDPKTPVLPVFDNGLMVLEVKFNRYLPESIKCALGSVSAVKRSAISKYVLCRKYY
jgi:hypothetical protein